MARLANLGQPFGSPGRIINIPAPAGSQLAGQIQMRAMEGLGRALGGYLAQKKQQELWQQDLQNYQLAQQSQLPQGMVGPQMGAPQMQSQIGRQAQMQSQLGQMFPSPTSPTQQLNQWRLGQLQGMTPEEQKQYMLKPPISITIPTGQALLTPEQRQKKAEADYLKTLAQKPLAPTEKKGVQATIKEIMGEGKTLPFGAKLGFALNQKDMDSKWEEAMEATGYAGRSKVQQRQIESEFDRYIAMLNKGKGIGVLKNQYQWNRRKYESKTIENITKEQFDSALRKITNRAAKQRYINQNWKKEFGSRIK